MESIQDDEDRQMQVSDSPLTFQMGGNIVARVFALIFLLPGLFVLYASWTAPSGRSDLGLLFGVALTVGGLQALVSTHKAVFRAGTLQATKISLLGFSRQSFSYQQVQSVKVTHRAIHNNGGVTDYYYVDLGLANGKDLRIAQSRGLDEIRQQAKAVSDETGGPFVDLDTAH